MKLEVLRLGHRPSRDKRITTHVCLTARALGARAVRIAEPDDSVVASVQSVVRRFGGDFTITAGTGWKGPVQAWKRDGGQVVHLTMYGSPLADAVARIQGDGRPVLVVVGAEKVPADLYELADHNVAVGSQPHSEVAALAIVLDRLTQGAWEGNPFPGGTIRVVPNPRGKTVLGLDAALDADAEE